jgi:D-alanine-D-alanine ligase-like ATP-grasp enzyme
VKKPFMPDILARIAPQLGADVLMEPMYQVVGLVRFPNGRRTFFWDNKLNLNPISSVKICRDKSYTSFFLKSLGYHVPLDAVFSRKDSRNYLQCYGDLTDAKQFARTLGWPVYMKPCRLSQGELVMTAYDEVEFDEWATLIFKRSRTVLVQRAYPGKDYRLVVLDGDVISAYERIPLQIEGDGINTVEELLNKKQAAFESAGRDTIIPIGDSRLDARLKRLQLSRQSIPASGQRVIMLEVSNLSLGGTIEDVTDDLHPTVAELASRISADLDLRFCGVDILTTDARRPLKDYVILEVNSAPGLDNYRYSGAEQEQYVDFLYLKLLTAAMHK